MNKKIPLRMCVVCKEMKPQKELLKVVKNKDGQIFVDNSYKANGRGAYICKDKSCFEKCKKTKALNRSFKCEVPQEVMEQIEKEIYLWEKKF